jgi:hypothetical protein
MKRARISKRPYTYKGKTADRWLVLWPDLEGTRHEKWFKDKRHAEAYARKISRELADLIHVGDTASITFGKACEAWLKHEERRADSRNRNADLTKGSLAAKKSVAKNHLLPAFGKNEADQYYFGGHQAICRRASTTQFPLDGETAKESPKAGA